jgi:hypothetical protein
MLKFLILCIASAVLFSVCFPSPVPANAQQPTSVTFGALALDTGKANFDKLWLESNGSYFSSYVTEVSAFAPAPSRTSVQVYVQAKDAKFSIEPSRLTRADIENGQEWDGTLTAVAAIVRIYEKDKGWGLWRDGPVILYKARYGRNRGTWTASGRAYIYDDNHELHRPTQAEIAALDSAPVNPPVMGYDGQNSGSGTVSGQ